MQGSINIQSIGRDNIGSCHNAKIIIVINHLLYQKNKLKNICFSYWVYKISFERIQRKGGLVNRGTWPVCADSCEFIIILKHFHKQVHVFWLERHERGSNEMKFQTNERNHMNCCIYLLQLYYCWWIIINLVRILILRIQYFTKKTQTLETNLDLQYFKDPLQLIGFLGTKTVCILNSDCLWEGRTPCPMRTQLVMWLENSPWLDSGCCHCHPWPSASEAF